MLKFLAKILNFDRSAPGNDKSCKFSKIQAVLKLRAKEIKFFAIMNLLVMKLGKSQNFKQCLMFWPKFLCLTALHLAMIKVANFQNY